MSVWDLWEYAGLGTYQQSVTTWGWNADGVHYSDVAQRAWAQMLFRILTSSLVASLPPRGVDALAWVPATSTEGMRNRYAFGA